MILWPGLMVALPLLMPSPAPTPPDVWAGFRVSPFYNERVRSEHTSDGIRAVLNAPADWDAAKPTEVIFFATPNGNTIEQTLGSGPAAGLDWHFYIQHIAAQTRKLRTVDRRGNIALVVVQADEKSWPAWRKNHTGANALIRAFVEKTAAEFPGADRKIVLTGHSGGGSFMFGYLEGGDAVPSDVKRIAFLDANYNFEAAEHGDKLLTWLKGDAFRTLVALAYDDRNITLDGKPVVGPTGGTFRATGRMHEAFNDTASFKDSSKGNLNLSTGMNGQIRLEVDRNPDNKILHTVLVETNGFLEAMTLSTPDEGSWGMYRGPHAYDKWITPSETDAPVGTAQITAIPPRPPGASGGAAFMARIADMTPADREAAILAEITSGNVPDFLRTFKTLPLVSVEPSGKAHTGAIDVAPDYLAVGSNADWVRVPMTPMTAQKIADAFGCNLPTERISDIVWRDAEVKLDPHPLSEGREAVSTFVQFNGIIEAQRGSTAPGKLVAGVKKDVVVTDRLREKPNKVAIYGWHHLDGSPIQPLYVGHKNTYVDYSHGIRLVARTMTVDGKPRDVRDVLKDPALCALISDEGPISVATY